MTFGKQGTITYGDSPSDALIHRLAEADEEKLIVLAEQVPKRIRKRIQERPEVL